MFSKLIRNAVSQLPAYRIRNVNGDANVGNSASITGEVGGDVSAGMNVTCNDIHGDVTAGMSVTCCDVGGDVTAGARVTSNNIQGNINTGI